ncbi:hypothetical protein DFS34DRAFT_119656 [Phlyctochytrium arcticum]|nr:hypothetical protein DFS34DRAFT_119656 [Phlyctochytrium arcticum]
MVSYLTQEASKEAIANEESASRRASEVSAASGGSAPDGQKAHWLDRGQPANGAGGFVSRLPRPSSGDVAASAPAQPGYRSTKTEPEIHFRPHTDAEVEERRRREPDDRRAAPYASSGPVRGGSFRERDGDRDRRPAYGSSSSAAPARNRFDPYRRPSADDRYRRGGGGDRDRDRDRAPVDRYASHASTSRRSRSPPSRRQQQQQQQRSRSPPVHASRQQQRQRSRSPPPSSSRRQQRSRSPPPRRQRSPYNNNRRRDNSRPPPPRDRDIAAPIAPASTSASAAKSAWQESAASTSVSAWGVTENAPAAPSGWGASTTTTDEQPSGWGAPPSEQPRRVASPPPPSRRRDRSRTRSPPSPAKRSRKASPPPPAPAAATSTRVPQIHPSRMALVDNP